MRYSGELLIPAGTPASDPATLVVPLCYGTIIEVEILFPPGQSGLTRLQIWYHERQILPTTEGSYFLGDDTLIDFPEQYPIHEEPLEVELRGWAPNAIYDHTVYVQISVERPAEIVVGGATYVPLPV